MAQRAMVDLRSDLAENFETVAWFDRRETNQGSGVSLKRIAISRASTENL